MVVLNPKYTFENFVVGSSNRFSHAAARAAAEDLGMRYNPLFIYGNSGLGKTHLMQAIGHEALKNNPDCKVVYVTSETFTDEYINAIRDGKANSFKNKYRRADLLLVDDIQFFAGKESTLEEFHHTFNALYENNKQIVLTSDRPPMEIQPIEERLRSRFSWGLTTNIAPPDLETRMAILKDKAETSNVVIDKESILYIADHVKANVRELEGALTRVIAFSSLNNSPISYDLCVEALKSILGETNKKPITVEDIQRVTAENFNIKVSDILSQKRSRDVSVPRQIAMYLSRELTDASLPKIGELFGGKDHSTVIYAHKLIAKEVINKTQISIMVNQIIEDLKK